MGGDVVEQEERLGAGREHVVDAVRGEVAARVAQPARAAREHELRADAVGGGREQAPLVERVEPGEGAERPRAGRVDSTAARSRLDHASAAASETPAASYVLPGAHGASLECARGTQTLRRAARAGRAGRRAGSGRRPRRPRPRRPTCRARAARRAPPPWPPGRRRAGAAPRAAARPRSRAARRSSRAAGAPRAGSPRRWR